MNVVWADQKYHDHTLRDTLNRQRNLLWKLEIVSRPADAKGFVLIPRRWVAERTFGWFGRSRRLSKDYERTIASSQSMIKLSAIV